MSGSMLETVRRLKILSMRRTAACLVLRMSDRISAAGLLSNAFFLSNVFFASSVKHRCPAEASFLAYAFFLSVASFGHCKTLALALFVQN